MTLPDLNPLPPQYDAATTEAEWYPRWTEHGVFVADAARATTREPYVIVMPPPNVTAVLHVGHGLNNTVQDVLIRWRRMAGDEALWLPGTDHAGIATQNVVEKQLAAEGQTRFDVGRSAFVSRVAEFVEQTGGEILTQLKAIGSSADWSRTAYTFSPELSVAVREAFVRLHEDGLVYKGHRVIHWCPRCGTSLSDEEAEFTDTAGKLYHLRYVLADDPSHSVIVATTRPETMLGDVAVAVHPDDERYLAFVGRDVVLPLNGVRIPVVADTYTDPAFGSGAVKITPAHDPNDFEVGKRHALAMPVIIDAAGVVREVESAAGRVPSALAGLDRFEARTKIVAMLEAAGALVKVEPHQHSVRHCYRCDTVVEPRLSDQWFVRMQPLAEKALGVLRSGELRILPDRWEAVYVNWLEGIRDWNISRQIWWGHRVPVWYCDACDQAPIVSRHDVSNCPTCGGTVRQDEDVLDTWFSSWLWPISTLGWPNADSADLKAFYPGDVLVTAPEILFFWVSRMVMSGCWFMGQSPFHTVYLHGTVRDMVHRKMSKSLGNGIDPLDVVRLYGADALRWTMVAGLGLGVDVMLDPNDLDKSFAPGRNFCTKLWNIGRFLLSRVGTEPVQSLAALADGSLTAADAWILERLDTAIDECNAALGPARPANGLTWTDAERGRGLRLSEYAEAARRFVWNELADWYLESIKPRLFAEGGADREVARAVLAHAFDGALRLLQPMIPFITEALWQHLPQTPDGEFLAQAAWPTARVAGAVSDRERALVALFESAREAVQGIRQVRAEYNVTPGAMITAIVNPTSESVDVVATQAAVIGSFTRAAITVSGDTPREAAASIVGQRVTIHVPLAGMIDLEKERLRLSAEIAQLQQALDALLGRLSNEKFMAKAPPAIVDAERAKAADWQARLALLRRKLDQLDA
ncbi:MAG: valine--tRNA ligase [Gemmatimonadaceae bacterium]|nr:valine--tRNA ligase [Gemmatimonadaceae bacterium]